MDITGITDEEFNRLRDVMYEVSGVRLMPTKKPLVMARLRKRLKELGMTRFGDYLELVNRPASAELEIFVNAITTNETSFYRHPEQFHFLIKKILPSFLKREEVVGHPEIRIWSAACSTGEEPYSLAIACQEFFKDRPQWKISIYASDINSSVLEFSQKALYSERSVSNMPPHLRKIHFEKVEGDPRYRKVQFQLHENIMRLVKFSQHNLLKPFPCEEMDIIFLRNAMIYFDRASKQRAVSLIEKNLSLGGYLIISMTESLQDVQSSLQYIHAGIYQKR